jgi:hypothetical protein
MIEISMLDWTSVYYQPSHLALSALYLAKKIMKHPMPWNDHLAKVTNLKEKEAQSLSQKLLNILKLYQSPQNKYNGLKQKFAQEKYSNISRLYGMTPIDKDHRSSSR